MRYEFTYKNLCETYEKSKTKKMATGRDKVNKENFKKNHTTILKLLETKIEKGEYIPTAFKEVLILKNKDSLPRRLSIPTIKDKIVIDHIKRNLVEDYSPIIKEKSANEFIAKIKQQIKSQKKYSHFIKLDIKNYYDNINHYILNSILEKNNYDLKLIELIEKIIQTDTLNELQNKGDIKRSNLGVPQGISISNILGSIYLNDVDEYFYNMKNIHYFRYVDDILIFYSEKNFKSDDLLEIVKMQLEKRGLQQHDEKKAVGRISDGFDYLGYHVEGNNISISKKRIVKFELSIEQLLKDYFYASKKRNRKNKKLLIWRLNLKITGLIHGEKKYGWLLFFQNCDSEEIFYHLDWLLRVKLNKRYDLDNHIPGFQDEIKSFVKVYKMLKRDEIKSGYIPRIDDFSRKEKEEHLISVYRRSPAKVKALNDYQIDYEFNRMIFRDIKSVTQDLSQIYF